MQYTFLSMIALYGILFILFLMFVTLLYYVYKKLNIKNEDTPKVFFEEELVSHKGEIKRLEFLNMNSKTFYYTVEVNNGAGNIEVKAGSKKEFKVGDKVTLVDYNESTDTYTLS